MVFRLALDLHSVQSFPPSVVLTFKVENDAWDEPDPPKTNEFSPYNQLSVDPTYTNSQKVIKNDQEDHSKLQESSLEHPSSPENIVQPISTKNVFVFSVL